MSPERLPYVRYRDRHGRQDRWRWLLAFVLALPLSLVLGGFAALLSLVPEGDLHLEKPPTQVALLAVPDQQWQQNRNVAQPGERQSPAVAAVPAEPQVKPEEKKPESDHIPGQIVDVAPTADQNVPADTHRYSEYNTHVKKETQAKDKTAFYKNAMPTHTTTEKPTKLPGKDMADKVQAIGSPAIATAKQAQEAKKPGHRVEIPNVEKRSKLDLQEGKGGEIPERTATEEVKGNSNRLRVEAGEGEQESAQASGNGGTGSHLNLIPSQSLLDRITGAPANDHLEGVDVGRGHLPEHPRVEVRGLLQPREAERGGALGSGHGDAPPRSLGGDLRLARPPHHRQRHPQQDWRAGGPGGGEELRRGLPRRGGHGRLQESAALPEPAVRACSTPTGSSSSASASTWR